MKSLKECEKEINKVLSEKIAVAIKDLKDQREKDMGELFILNQKLEEIEGKKNNFVDEKKGLNPLRNSDLGRLNELDIKLRWLDGELKSWKGQIEKITQKLIDFEVDPKTLNFLLHYKP
jgi:DNA repair exonuclease SbcCD ATPase subunit